MFHPLNTWSFGPLSVSIDLLFLFLSLLVALIVMSFYLKSVGISDREIILDKIILAIIVAVLVYKLWPFVLEPGLMNNFRNIIYFSGGPWGITAAFISGLLTLMVSFYRNKLSYKLWETLLIGLFAAMIFYYLFVREYGRVSPFPFGHTLEGITVHPVNFYYVWLYSISYIGAFYFFHNTHRYLRMFYLLGSLLVIYYLIDPFRV